MSNEDVRIVLNQMLEKASNIKDAIGVLESDIQKIQIGDDNGAYWNGKNAYDCIKTSLLQIEYNKELLEELNKSINNLQSSIK